MINDPFNMPRVDTTPEALADAWARILDDAKASDSPVGVRLISGDLYAGRIVAVESTSVGIEQRESGKVYQHTIALSAIIALTFDYSTDS